MEKSIARHIVITPDVCFGKPRIAGHRISVADVAIMYLRTNLSLEEIAAKYNLELASVFAAMSYYFDHREEIERKIKEDEAFVEVLQRKSRSPNRAKLQAVKNG